MRHLCVFGNPIAHSLSPLLHNAVLQAYGLPYLYGRYALESTQSPQNSDFSHTKSNHTKSKNCEENALRRAFYDLELSGANITLPFKEQAFIAADSTSSLATHIGAVNTLVRFPAHSLIHPKDSKSRNGDKHDTLIGYNTDAPGFIASLLLCGFWLDSSNVGEELDILAPLFSTHTPTNTFANFSSIPSHTPTCHNTLESTNTLESALILGAGGSAKAIALALHKCGVKVTIANRSSHAQAFFASKNIPYYTFDKLDSSAQFTLIVNATSASINGLLPLEESVLRKLFANARIVYDLMYGREMPFLELGRAYGLAQKDGADMLILQAACALMLFCQELRECANIRAVYTLMRSVFPR